MVEWTRSRAVAVSVVVALLGATVTACSRGDHATKQSAPRVGPSSEVIDGQVTKVVSPSGVMVTIPADSASGGTLTVAETSPTETKPGAVSTRIPGDPVEVTLTDGELTGSASIEFPLASDSASALPIVERFNESTGIWEPVPVGDVEVSDTSVSVETSRFSWYRPSWLSVDRVARFMRDRWFDVFGDGLAGGEQPTCPRDAETLEQFSWTSSSDLTLLWCVGTNDDGAVIANIVNNNRYPVALSTSENMRQLGKFGGSWSAAALGAAFDEWGSGQVVLEPTEGVTLHLVDGTNGTYELTSDFTLLTWAIGMLSVALSTYIDIWTKSGTDLETAQEKLAFSVSAAACTVELGPKLLTDPGAWTEVRTLLVEMFGCAGDVVRDALESEGWMLRQVGAAVAFVTGPVFAAFEGLVALGEISLDSLARRATYDLNLVSIPDPAPRADPAPTPIDLQAVAAGNFTSLIGSWTGVARASNPHDGSGQQWEYTDEITIDVSDEMIVINELVSIQGSSLFFDKGSGPQTYPLLFRSHGNYLSASNEGVIPSSDTNWSLGIYPRGSVDLNSMLEPNNEVTLDSSKDAIYLWSSNNGIELVFYRA